MEGVAASTSFSVSCSGWQDESTVALKYEIYYYEDNDSSLAKQRISLSESSLVDFPMAEGSWYIYVDVIDDLSMRSNPNQMGPITVNPLPVEDFSAVLDNLDTLTTETEAVGTVSALAMTIFNLPTTNILENPSTGDEDSTSTTIENDINSGTITTMGPDGPMVLSIFDPVMSTKSTLSTEPAIVSTDPVTLDDGTMITSISSGGTDPTITTTTLYPDGTEVVVVQAPNEPAVATITNPDGTQTTITQPPTTVTQTLEGDVVATITAETLTTPTTLSLEHPSGVIETIVAVIGEPETIAYTIVEYPDGTTVMNVSATEDSPALYTVTNPDGTIETITASLDDPNLISSTIIEYPDGTIVETTIDPLDPTAQPTVTTTLIDGTTQVLAPPSNGAPQTLVITNPDQSISTQTMSLDDPTVLSSIITTYPDGTTETVTMDPSNPDEVLSITTTFIDGTEAIVSPATVSSPQTMVITYPTDPETTETRVSTLENPDVVETITTTNIDGTIVVLSSETASDPATMQITYPDGSVVTKTAILGEPLSLAETQSTIVLENDETFTITELQPSDGDPATITISMPGGVTQTLVANPSEPELVDLQTFSYPGGTIATLDGGSIGQPLVLTITNPDGSIETRTSYADDPSKVETVQIVYPDGTTAITTAATATTPTIMTISHPDGTTEVITSLLTDSSSIASVETTYPDGTIATSLPETGNSPATFTIQNPDGTTETRVAVLGSPDTVSSVTLVAVDGTTTSNDPATALMTDVLYTEDGATITVDALSAEHSSFNISSPYMEFENGTTVVTTLVTSTSPAVTTIEHQDGTIEVITSKQGDITSIATVETTYPDGTVVTSTAESESSPASLFIINPDGSTETRIAVLGSPNTVESITLETSDGVTTEGDPTTTDMSSISYIIGSMEINADVNTADVAMIIEPTVNVMAPNILSLSSISVSNLDGTTSLQPVPLAESMTTVPVVNSDGEVDSVSIPTQGMTQYPVTDPTTGTMAMVTMTNNINEIQIDGSPTTYTLSTPTNFDIPSAPDIIISPVYTMNTYTVTINGESTPIVQPTSTFNTVNIIVDGSPKSVPVDLTESLAQEQPSLIVYADGTEVSIIPSTATSPVQVIIKYFDGRTEIRTADVDGNLVSSTTTYPDGTTVIYLVETENSTAKFTLTHPDGTVETRLAEVNNPSVIASITTEWPDSTIGVNYPNQSPNTLSLTYPDGTTEVRVANSDDSNEILSNTITYPEPTNIIVTLTAETGNTPAVLTIQYPDGTVEKRTALLGSPDVVNTVTITEPDGHVITSSLDSNQMVTTVTITNLDGTTETRVSAPNDPLTMQSVTMTYPSGFSINMNSVESPTTYNLVYPDQTTETRVASLTDPDVLASLSITYPGGTSVESTAPLDSVTPGSVLYPDGTVETKSLNPGTGMVDITTLVYPDGTTAVLTPQSGSTPAVLKITSSDGTVETRTSTLNNPEELSSTSISYSDGTTVVYEPKDGQLSSLLITYPDGSSEQRSILGGVAQSSTIYSDDKKLVAVSKMGTLAAPATLTFKNVDTGVVETRIASLSDPSQMAEVVYTYPDDTNVVYDTSTNPVTFTINYTDGRVEKRTATLNDPTTISSITVTEEGSTSNLNINGAQLSSFFLSDGSPVTLSLSMASMSSIQHTLPDGTMKTFSVSSPMDASSVLYTNPEGTTTLKTVQSILTPDLLTLSISNAAGLPYTVTVEEITPATIIITHPDNSVETRIARSGDPNEISIRSFEFPDGTKAINAAETISSPATFTIMNADGSSEIRESLMGSPSTLSTLSMVYPGNTTAIYIIGTATTAASLTITQSNGITETRIASITNPDEVQSVSMKYPDGTLGTKTKPSETNPLELVITYPDGRVETRTATMYDANTISSITIKYPDGSIEAIPTSSVSSINTIAYLDSNKVQQITTISMPSSMKALNVINEDGSSTTKLINIPTSIVAFPNPTNNALTFSLPLSNMQTVNITNPDGSTSTRMLTPITTQPNSYSLTGTGSDTTNTLEVNSMTSLTQDGKVKSIGLAGMQMGSITIPISGELEPIMVETSSIYTVTIQNAENQPVVTVLGGPNLNTYTLVGSDLTPNMYQISSGEINSFVVMNPDGTARLFSTNVISSTDGVFNTDMLLMSDGTIANIILSSSINASGVVEESGDPFSYDPSNDLDYTTSIYDPTMLVFQRNPETIISAEPGSYVPIMGPDGNEYILQVPSTSISAPVGGINLRNPIEEAEAIDASSISIGSYQTAVLGGMNVVSLSSGSLDHGSLFASSIGTNAGAAQPLNEILAELGLSGSNENPYMILEPAASPAGSADDEEAFVPIGTDATEAVFSEFMKLHYQYCMISCIPNITIDDVVLPANKEGNQMLIALAYEGAGVVESDSPLLTIYPTMDIASQKEKAARELGINLPPDPVIGGTENSTDWMFNLYAPSPDLPPPNLLATLIVPPPISYGDEGKTIDFNTIPIVVDISKITGATPAASMEEQQETKKSAMVDSAKAQMQPLGDEEDLLVDPYSETSRYPANERGIDSTEVPSKSLVGSILILSSERSYPIEIMADTTALAFIPIKSDGGRTISLPAQVSSDMIVTVPGIALFDPETGSSYMDQIQGVPGWASIPEVAKQLIDFKSIPIPMDITGCDPLKPADGIMTPKYKGCLETVRKVQDTLSTKMGDYIGKMTDALSKFPVPKSALERTPMLDAISNLVVAGTYPKVNPIDGNIEIATLVKLESQRNISRIMNKVANSIISGRVNEISAPEKAVLAESIMKIATRLSALMSIALKNPPSAEREAFYRKNFLNYETNTPADPTKIEYVEEMTPAQWGFKLAQDEQDNLVNEIAPDLENIIKKVVQLQMQDIESIVVDPNSPGIREKILSVDGGSIALVGGLPQTIFSEDRLYKGKRFGVKIPKDFCRSCEPMNPIVVGITKMDYNLYKVKDFKKTLSDCGSLEISLYNLNTKEEIPVKNEAEPLQFQLEQKDLIESMQFVYPILDEEELLKMHVLGLHKQNVSISFEVKPTDFMSKFALFWRFGEFPSAFPGDYDGFAFTDTGIIKNPNWKRLGDALFIRKSVYNWFLPFEELGNRLGLYYVAVGQVAYINRTTTNGVVIMEPPYTPQGLIKKFGVINESGHIIKQPDLVPVSLNVGDETWTVVFTRNFTTGYHYRIQTKGGYYYDDNSEFQEWKSDGCSPIISSNPHATSTECKHLTLFGGGLFVAPNKPDFDYIFKNLGFTQNLSIYISLIIIYILYIILGIWAVHADRQDVKKTGSLPLPDNDPVDKYVYEIITFTGMRNSASTDSHVHFVLSGDRAETDVRSFDGYIRPRPLFRSGAADSFVMTTRQPLGHLQYLRLWHDNSGRGAFKSWYCSRVMIIDCQTGEQYPFIVNKWLALDEDDGLIERMIPVSGDAELTEFSHLVKTRTKFQMTDSHLWFSVFARPPLSRFTRFQRLSCCMSLLVSSMFASALFYGVLDPRKSTNIFKFGPFTLSVYELGIGILSNLISIPFNLVLVFLFRRSRMRKKRQSHVATALSDGGSYDTHIRVHPTKDKKQQPGLMAFFNSSIPYWFRYIAWFFTIASIVIFTVFVLFYGITFGDEKARKWLTSMITSLFTSILFTQPIKILIAAVVCSCICRKSFDEEDYEEDEQLLEVNNGEEYIDNNSTATKGHFIEKSHMDVLEDSKQERVREKEMFNFLIDLLVYAFFILVLSVIAYGSRDSDSYYYTQELRNQFLRHRDGESYSFEKIRSPADFFDWGREVLTPAIRAKWYNNMPPTDERKFFADLNSRILGYPIIRQIRSKDINQCKIVPEMRSIFSHCSRSSGMFTEDEADYSPGWDPPGYGVNTRTEYTFESWKELKGLPISGRIDTYSGGGYVVKLDEAQFPTTERLNLLEKEGWIDNRTRAIFVEFAMYNAQTNMFSVNWLLLESVYMGAFAPISRFDPVRLYRGDACTFKGNCTKNVAFHGLLIVFCEIVFMLYIFVFLILQVRDFREMGLRKYFTSFYVWLELTIIVLAFSSVAFLVGRILVTDEISNTFIETHGNVYVKLQHALYLDEMFTLCITFILFLANIKLLRLFKFSSMFEVLVATLSNLGKELMAFLVMFGIFYMAFCSSLYLLLQRKLVQYSDFLYVLEEAFSAMLGKFDFSEIVAASQIAPWVFFIFMVMQSLILLNCLITIITVMFQIVKEDVNRRGNDSQVMDLLLRRAKRAVGLKSLDNRRKAMPTKTGNKATGQETENLFNARVDKILKQVNNRFLGGSVNLDSAGQDYQAHSKAQRLKNRDPASEWVPRPSDGN